MRLGGIDVYPFEPGERRGVKPGAIRDKRVATEISDSRFQMQTAGDGNRDNFIVVRRKNGGKLTDALGIAAPGEADKEFLSDAKNIAAFESAGKRDVFELSKLGQRFGQWRSLATARFGS